MRIQDAKPGDVLRDKDGDAWHLDEEGATVSNEWGDSAYWLRSFFYRADECYGPFTRLVPEHETP